MNSRVGVNEVARPRRREVSAAQPLQPRSTISRCHVDVCSPQNVAMIAAPSRKSASL